MFFLEDKNFLNDTQKKYIDELLLYENMSFKLATQAAEVGDNGFHFINHILKLEEKEKNTLKQHEKLIDIFRFFLQKNKIKINTLFRVAINITFNNGFVYKCPIHTDHNFEHRQVILYLNDAVGDTIICNKNKEPVIISKPEKYKAIVFDKQPHYHYFPNYGLRAIAVFTFN